MQATGTITPAVLEEPPPRPRVLRDRPGFADRIYRSGARLVGLFVFLLMGSIGCFLAWRGSDAIRGAGWGFFTTAEWQPEVNNFGIAAVLSGTVLIATVAVVVSVPLALSTALFISEIAPQRWRAWLISGIDLMAAVPSVVYGLWGAVWLEGEVIGVARWISTWFGWIPFLHVDGADPTNPLATASVYTGSTLLAGLTVSMMVAPIQCSVMREAFSQAPAGEREGAYALGATRWGMIRSVVLPFGRGGIIGGTMLGLGRALGETIAVVLVISTVFEIRPRILEGGTSSISSLIALRYGEASGFGLSALMAAGLALFLITMAVNFTASTIAARSRSGAQSEA
ncbi:phosphate transport system permease protein [Catenuloplanes nepalensis]|uniref:Phosphate transport system permease protein n=1 Tax=Catenuloplanes nepalensis TaxID=587533 RepID=A0ABT9N0L9_9ACTN|nr:phosphate ABC transporter permease subunit PstC [Catenuloplanes nepalensis]MDP9797246.1 phosphate transport system permease protein [Catenuloplanes nepalensis]